MQGHLVYFCSELLYQHRNEKWAHAKLSLSGMLFSICCFVFVHTTLVFLCFHLFVSQVDKPCDLVREDIPSYPSPFRLHVTSSSSPDAPHGHLCECLAQFLFPVSAHEWVIWITHWHAVRPLRLWGKVVFFLIVTHMSTGFCCVMLRLSSSSLDTPLLL